MCTQLLCLISIDHDIKASYRVVAGSVVNVGEEEVKPEAGAWRSSTTSMRPNFTRRFSVDPATEDSSRLGQRVRVNHSGGGNDRGESVEM